MVRLDERRAAYRGPSPVLAAMPPGRRTLSLAPHQGQIYTHFVSYSR